VFRYRPRLNIARMSTPSAARETFFAGIPNTLPPQNLKTECWSLAASEFALAQAGESRTLLRVIECKTGIYNMLQ
jgi:hypothetical protein